jgi:hypothetical protein
MEETVGLCKNAYSMSECVCMHVCMSCLCTAQAGELRSISTWKAPDTNTGPGTVNPDLSVVYLSHSSRVT